MLKTNMEQNRGQGNPKSILYGFVTLIIVVIVAQLGLYLFSEFDQHISIPGRLSGTGHEVLVEGANVLPMAVGGSSLVLLALAYLRARTGR